MGLVFSYQCITVCSKVGDSQLECQKRPIRVSKETYQVCITVCSKVGDSQTVNSTVVW